jgi:F420-0:gamma-glutamyl ligase
MKIAAVKTRLVHAGEISLNDLLIESIADLPEKSIVAISSKVVALAENSVLPRKDFTRQELIEKEAEWYLDPEKSSQGYYFTIVGNTLVSCAGIDESNADGQLVLWPRHPFASASQARKALLKKFGRRNLGIIITDSVSSPLRRGTKGEMIAWSGFEAVRNYVGDKDLFGRNFTMEMSGIGVSLAVAANVVMGEGSERTPLAVISDIDFVKFHDHDPTPAEIKTAFVPFDDDLFMPFLKLMNWKKGGR